jgi:hypothetical protein
MSNRQTNRFQRNRHENSSPYLHPYRPPMLLAAREQGTGPQLLAAFHYLAQACAKIVATLDRTIPVQHR